MSPQMLERISTAWFDSVSQQLDALQEDCKTLDDESTPPSPKQFELAKKMFEDIRLLAQFPNLPKPDMWPGVNGEIGMTLVFSDTTLELIVKDRIFARLFTNTQQAVVEVSQIPKILHELSSKTAA